MSKTVADIEASLRPLGTLERAEGEKRYLKSELDFLGVKIPQLRKAAQAWLKARPELSRGELVKSVSELWETPIHELRSFGIFLLQSRWRLLEAEDLDLLEDMLRRSHTWAYVDTLAVHVVGPIIEGRSELSTVLDRWSRDDDFWIRRSALLALLLPFRRGEGDWRRFTRFADSMIEEKEFFIRKAIGWVLREAVKSDSERVEGFVSRRIGKISGVTLREAVRKLPTEDRDRLMKAYRER